MDKLVCRKCVLTFSDKEENITCRICKNPTERVINPVSVHITNIRPGLSKQAIENTLSMICMEFRLPDSGENRLGNLPAKVVSTISREKGLAIASRLESLGAGVRVVSDETSEELKTAETVKKRILVVEDNNLQRNQISEILERNGMIVEKAEHGVAAIAHLSRNSNFDLVITDLNMPHMDGIKLMQYIRANRETKTVPIIVLTAGAGREDVKSVLTFNVAGYILKPVDEAKVLMQVEIALKAK